MKRVDENVQMDNFGQALNIEGYAYKPKGQFESKS